MLNKEHYITDAIAWSKAQQAKDAAVEQPVEAAEPEAEGAVAAETPAAPEAPVTAPAGEDTEAEVE